MRTDNGSEFVNKEMHNFLNERGIRHERSAPYCPESIGRIERETRTVKEGARTLLLASQLPSEL